MLIDNALVYGEQSKTDDAASLRLISTQAPALMSAIEVMAEQCYKRYAVITCVGPCLLVYLQNSGSKLMKALLCLGVHTRGIR